MPQEQGEETGEKATTNLILNLGIIAYIVDK
jgi:hypothetical protein